MLDRNDIIEKVAAKGYTKKDAKVILDDIFEVITEALADGEDVKLHGFGTFCVREIASRTTKDYRSGERITIPSHKVPKFVPGGALRRAVKEGIFRT